MPRSVGKISKDNYLKWVQRSLNRILGTHVPADGHDSESYRGAVRAFNREYLQIESLTRWTSLCRKNSSL